jgi:hypothetical protein
MTDQYVPGTCNIGPEEIALRRRAGHIGLAVTAALATALLRSNANRAWRLTLALPAAGAASGYLQARPALLRQLRLARRLQLRHPRPRTTGGQRPGPGRRPSPSPPDLRRLGGHRAERGRGRDAGVGPVIPTWGLR